MKARQRAPQSAAVVAAAAVLAVLATYAPALRFGLLYDDYLLRARSWPELAAVWRGTWDPVTRFLPDFYRPLAVWTDAAAFAAVGTSPVGLHVIALVELAAAASLVGLFVARELNALTAGVAAAVLLAVHPALATSAGPFFFQQNHRLSLVIVGAALLAWQRRRDVPTPSRWWPIFGCATIGFLLKEDAVMILPAIVVAQFLYKRPTRALLAATAAWLVGLTALHEWLVPAAMLHGWRVDAASLKYVTFNALRSVKYAVWHFHGLTQADDGPYWMGSMISAIAVAGAGAWTLIAGTPAARRLLLVNAVLLVAFMVPMLPQDPEGRGHLVVLPVVLTLAAGVDTAWTWAATRHGRIAVVGAVSVAVVVVLGVTSRTMIDWYAPCAPGDRVTSEAWLQWTADSPTLAHGRSRAQIAAALARCADGR